MSWKKTHDLAVVTGTYQKDGEEKKRYHNVGKVMTSDDGGEMMFINRAFNPAGIPPRDPNDESILIYKFEVKDKAAPEAKKSAAEQPAKKHQAVDDYDGIPF